MLSRNIRNMVFRNIRAAAMITRARLIATKNLRGLLAGPSTKDERGIHPNRVRQCQSIKCLDSIWGCHTKKCQGNHPESMLGRGASTPFFASSYRENQWLKAPPSPKKWGSRKCENKSYPTEHLCTYSILSTRVCRSWGYPKQLSQRFPHRFDTNPLELAFVLCYGTFLIVRTCE